MSSVLSLSDVGFRRFGALPGVGGLDAQRVATVASKCGDYEVAGPWVRRRARRKGGQAPDAFQIIDVLDRDAELTQERLTFVDDYFRSEFATADVPRLTTQSDVLVDVAGLVEKEECRWRGMYRLHQALALAGPQRLKPLLREYVAPAFFRLYPSGKIAVVKYNSQNDDAAVVMRALYAGAQAQFQTLQKDLGIHTLQGSHLNSLTQVGPLFFNLFLYLFYPFIGGYRGGPVGLDFMFLFEPSERYSPDLYPRNWLAVASTAASFGRENVSLYDALQDFQGPAWRHAAHQRHQFDHGYSIEQRLDLLGWYVERINRLLFELTDVANFTEGCDPGAVIDPVFAFEHHLTVDRLGRKTLLAMSLEEVGAAKHLAFEVAELYDGMSKLFGNHADATEFFKRLFHPREAPALLRDRLAGLPLPFGTDLPALADDLYRRIEDKLLDSVWVKSKVTATGVLVRGKDPSREELLDRPEFVAELMRAYRNAHHGYFTAADRQSRPSRFLFLVDGDLPAELTALPSLWWLAYLADPGLVGWKHLPVDHYD